MERKYLNGAQSWLVPRSDFSASSPVFYRRFSDTPEGNGIGKETKESAEEGHGAQVLPQKPCKRTGSALIRETMFPPCNNAQSNDLPPGEQHQSVRKEVLCDIEGDEMSSQLKNCVRVYPHHLDSGGFFFAVIERMPRKPAISSSVGTNSSIVPKPVDQQPQKSTKWDGVSLPSKFPPAFLKPNQSGDPAIEKKFRDFLDFYGLVGVSGPQAGESEQAPFPVDNVVLTGGKKSLKFTLVSPDLASLCLGGARFTPIEAGLSLCWVDSQDEETLQPGTTQNSSRFTAAKWCLLDEAVPLVAQFAHKRTVKVGRRDFTALLEAGQLDLPHFAHLQTWCAGGVVVQLCECAPASTSSDPPKKTSPQSACKNRELSRERICSRCFQQLPSALVSCRLHCAGCDCISCSRDNSPGTNLRAASALLELLTEQKLASALSIGLKPDGAPS